MNTQHKINIPELMSENNTMALSQSRQKRLSTSRVLSLIMMMMLWMWGNSAWAQTNFEIDLMKETPVLPSGVTATNDGAHGPSYNGSHGWRWYVFKFAPDCPVKITLQKCYHGNSACVKDASGNVLKELDTKQTESNCNGEVSWIYDNHGQTNDIYVHCGEYCHYVKVEAVNDVPTQHTVSFADGGETYKGILPKSASVNNGESYTLPAKNTLMYKDGYTLTGWECNSQTYAMGETVSNITADMQFTPVFRQNTKNLSDRTGTIELNWDMSATSGLNMSGSDNVFVTQTTIAGETIDVALDITGTFKTNGDWVAIANGTSIGIPSCQSANIEFRSYNNPSPNTKINGEALTEIDAVNHIVNYVVSSTTSTATMSFTNNPYLKYIKVTLPDASQESEYTSNENYDAIVSNVKQLQKALLTANGTSRFKILVKNGTYDLGTAYDTKVKNNVTIIGESRDGVIITNHPEHEGIWTSSVLRTGSNVVMQNLTLWSQVVVGSGGQAGARRGVTIYDDGNNNAYVNLLLKGTQDTYYSSEKTKSYFEKCEIHGDVDFICGSGTVWFEECDLKIEQNANSWIVAPKTDAVGYTFNNCTISNADGAKMDGVYYLGRGWEGHPKTVFAGSYDNYIIKAKNFSTDGYDRNSWARGQKTDAEDNAGMTKQVTPFTKEQAATTMGSFVTKSSPLTAPQNVVLANGTLTWTAVQGAERYYIYKNGSFEASVTTNSYTIPSSAKPRTATRRAPATSEYSVAAVADNGLIGLMADATSGDRNMKDFQLDFTGTGSFIRGLQSIIDGKYQQNAPCITGVKVTEDNGTPTFVAADAADACVVLNAKYHGTSYGIVPNSTFVVPVDGPVKFTYGTSNYSTKVTVTDADGHVIATISPYNKNTYKSSNTDWVIYGYYSGGETTLTFTGGSYVPYFAVQKVSSAEVPCAVNYNLTGVTGPERYTEYTTSGSQITLPGRVYYKPGYTLLGWTDGINNYDLGQSVTINSDITFTPRFRENTKTLEDRTEPLTIKWDLGIGNAAPLIDMQGSTGFVIAQATVDGEVIDVKMDIDATASADASNKSKVSNAGRNDKWANVTKNAKFTIPHYKGATVSYQSYKESPNTTIDGEAGTKDADNVYSKEVSADKESIDIVFGEANDYLSYIQTVLPVVEGGDQGEVVLYSLNNSIGSAEVTASDAIVTAGTSLVLKDTKGRIKITPKAGEKFKNGDKITFSGTIGNNTKNYGITIFAADGTTDAGQLYVAGTTNPLAVEGTLTLSADADYIYIGRYAGTTTTLTSCEITGNRVKRTFKDFEVNMKTNPYTVIKPVGGLPTGVSISGNYHNEHGYYSPVVSVPVDGPVKITIGCCQHSKTTATIYDGTTLLETLDVTTPGCSGTASYVYNSLTPTTLTINCGQYCPSIKVEACELITKCETPSISSDDENMVTITQNDKTDGAKTYYTIDGADPTASSTEYTAPFEATSNCTVKAVTICAGRSNSDIASLAVTVKTLKPVIAMANDKSKATITNKQSGATVYYTLDGSVPSSTNYDGSFTEASKDIPVTDDMWIKAITVKDGLAPSAMTAYLCRINFHDFEWDLTGNTPLLGTEKNDFETGVIVDSHGNSYLCDKADPSASISVKTKWNDSSHGYAGWIASIPVEGNVDIYLGNCQYGGGTMTINPGGIDLQQLGTTEPKTCYHQNKTENFNVVHYVGGATTIQITCTGTVYVPYFAVKDARRASDLAIKSGKESVNLTVNETYTLTKDVDFTSTATSFTYTSSNPEIATVSADGKITAGANYGRTTITVRHESTSSMAAGEIQFTIRVIAAAGQTHKPSVNISADGAVTITKGDEDETPKFYYTLDGTEPTESSATTTGAIPASDANGKVIKMIAATDGKSPSDVVTAYVNVTGDIVWNWNEGGSDVNLVPTISPSIKGALNSNTQAVIGNMLTSGWADVTGKGKFAAFQPKDKTVTLDEQHTVQFNIIPVVGIQFKPTSITFDASRVGTDGGSMDTKLMSGTTVYNLLENKKPDRSNASTGPTYTSFTPDVSAIPASDNEWALQMYIYNLNNTAKYALSNIVVSGTFTGIEYDGVFYSITASTNPAEGGSVRHVPSASKIAAGKDATFIATPSIGYRFSHWTYLDQTKSIGTEKTLVVSSIDKDVDVEAHFEMLPRITFECKNSSVEGSVPEAQYTDEDGTFFIPYNYTLYRPKTVDTKQRWSITAWTDGETVYELGTVYTFTKDTKLTPILTSTEKDITDVSSPTAVRWNFDNKEDVHAAPTVEIANDHTDPPFSYTKQAVVDGEKLDMKMIIDVTSGKFTNADARVIGMDGLGAQVNNGTKFIVPAVDGMKVRVKASGKKDTLQDYNSQGDFSDGSTVNITFDGATGTATDDKTLEYTYTGDAATLDIVFVEAGTKANSSKARTGSWGFYEYIEVVYPVLPDVVLENRIVTTPLLSDKELAENAGTVKKSDNTHPNTGSRYKQGDNVTITAEAKYGYYISAIKSGDTTLDMTKVMPSADAAQPTKATATYIVGAKTGIVTVEYERLAMSKVRLETTDIKLGDVDFASGSIHENFYTKGEGWVESWFVVGNTETAVSIAADDYIIKEWTDESGDQVETTNACSITVTAEPKTFFASFMHGQKGNVIFDIESPVIVEGTTIKDLPAGFGAKHDANSLAPSAVTNSYSFTIPKYHTVFKTGYTLKFWKNKDDDNTYMLGSNYSFQTDGENITLVPVYEKNPSDQMNRVNDPIMLYEFGTGAGIRAQQVKLEKNTNTYWTTQVHVVTITDGKEHPHDRDVAMWVNTGEKGFVRNGDLPEWASFGPGTTFTIASCAGTKVEILSYAPMSTTTFDGQPFTLVSADEKKHEYIYECTTQSTEARVPIVIGDDYSYYKYIKVYSLKANRVNLHIDVDDKTRGRIDAIQAINTTVEAPIIDLEDGGKSFHQGNNVKITFKRRFGFEFDKIIDVERVDAEGNPLAVVEVLDNGKVKMVKTKDTFEFEELTPTSDGKGGWSTELDLTKHIFYVKKTEPAVDKDDEDMVDSLRTEYEVQFNITTHRNLQVCFKEKPTYYVTYNAGKQATGTAPAAAWIEAGDEFLIPENRTLYYEGYTLKYWKDANYNEDATYEYNKTKGHAYEIGHEYTNPGKDILLYPVFEKNTFGLLDIPAGDGIKVTWPFAKKLGAPTINYEHSAGILVSQLKKSETEWIDLKVDLDGMNGKFNNTAYTDRCQINNNSVLTFPSTNGCEISLHALKEISATTIAGSTNYTKGTDVTTTYNGTEAEQQVLFENGTYPTHFEVTYKPQNITQPTLASVQYGDVTLTPEQLTTLTTSKAISVTVDPDVVNDAVPTVSATANNGVVTVTQADIDNRSAIITLKTTGGVLVETYSVDFSFNVPKTAPKFIKYVIAGVEYPEGQTEIHIDNLPVSGTVRAIFDRTMAEKSIPSLLNDGTYYTAPEGKELAFNYWNLPVDTESSLTVPANVLEDVYGKKYDQVLRITFKTASTTMTPVHRTFNYIVGKDGDINSAITAANAATGTDRYYVFIPDGDYELTGNETIISRITSDGVAPADSTGANRTDLLNTSVDNHMTQISRANVSLIGQSTQGVTLFNRPLLEGIGYTATIHVGKNALDFYAEDLQLVNRFPYWKSLNAQGSSGAGRAVVFWDQGNRSIMKNVEMWSYQDTYYSSNATPEYRGYFENCTIAGVVDWLCGDGNIWLEKCDIVIRDRAGNNLAAPSQEKNQLWGYVFNECNIKPEVDNPKELKDKNWSLARPWANSEDKSPAATFLKTKMWILPRDAGWEKMGTGAVLRFHEYHSMDKGGNVISLGSRSLAACAPGAGSDDCILSPTDAAKYTLENVMGGSDLFTPKAFTQQIDAKSNNGHKDWDANNSLTWNDDIETDDDRLQWRTEPMALCYFVFKKDEETGKWKYITNVAQSSDDETITGLSIEQYGSGIYMVRAANQRGGLGAPTKEVEFTVSTKYVLSIKQLGDLKVDGVPYGWSTICLPYNSKVPTTDIDGIAKDIKVYAANGNNVEQYDVTNAHDVSNYNIYLKRVDKMNKNLGYVVYGPVGDYQFASSSHTSDVVTILSGNPTDETIPTGNNNCYVLSNKSTWGLGFYKYTGATLAAHRAWLPITAVNNTVQQGVSNNAKCISLVILEGDDIVTKVEVPYAVDPDVDVIYNLNGIRVMSPTPGHLYIINGKKMIWK